MCSLPPAIGLNGTTHATANNSIQRQNPSSTATNKTRNRHRLLSGGWVNDDLNSPYTIDAVQYAANKYKDTVTHVRVSQKQVVAGINRYVEFEALAFNGSRGVDSDTTGKLFHHKSTIWVMHNGTMNIMKHERVLLKKSMHI